MKAELFISKSRVPYIIEALGADRVVVDKLDDGDQDLIKFEVDSPLDLLHMFHAGIQFGSDSMAKALIR
jgi:hypothetical protein